MSGEAAACDVKYALHWQKNILPTLTDGYAAEDIYNMDETGLFFKCLPNRTLAFKGEKCHGGKQSKERITVIPMCNMTGTHKLPLIVIGKSENPHGMKNARKNNTLPVEYYHNSKAWMTSKLFQRVLVKMDDDFHADGRKILLFIDNCSAHKLQPTTVLKAITIEFLPPNFTSLLQPLDAGIIKNLKDFYRKRLLRKSIQHMTEHHALKKISVLEAIQIISDSWSEDVKCTTIANCFRHAGFGLYELGDNSIAQNEQSIDLMEEDSNDTNDAESLVAEFTNALQLMNNGTVSTDSADYSTAVDYMNIDDDVIAVGDEDTDSVGSTSTESAVDDESAGETTTNSAISVVDYMNIDVDVIATGDTDTDSVNSTSTESVIDDVTAGETTNFAIQKAGISDETFDEVKANKAAILRVQRMLQRSNTVPDSLKTSLNGTHLIMKHLLDEYASFRIVLNTLYLIEFNHMLFTLLPGLAAMLDVMMMNRGRYHEIA